VKCSEDKEQRQALWWCTRKAKTAKELVGGGGGGISKYLKIWIVDRYLSCSPVGIFSNGGSFFFGTNFLKIKLSEGLSLQGVNI